MFNLKHNVKENNEDKVIHIAKRLIQEIKFKQRLPSIRKGILDEVFLVNSIGCKSSVIKDENSNSFRTLVIIS